MRRLETFLTFVTASNAGLLELKSKYFHGF